MPKPNGQRVRWDVVDPSSIDFIRRNKAILKLLKPLKHDEVYDAYWLIRREKMFSPKEIKALVKRVIAARES